MRRFRDLFFRLFQRLDSRANRILFYFVLAYALLMLLPVLVFVTSLSGSATMLKSQYEASALTIVKDTATQVNSVLALISQFDLETLQSPSGLSKRMRSLAAGARFDALDVRELFEDMPTLADSSGLIRGYRLYLSGADIVLEPGLGYQRPELLYQQMLCYDGMPYEQWIEQVCLYSGPALVYPASPCVFGSELNCIVISRPYSADSSRVIGRTLYYIDSDRLCSLFNGLLRSGSNRLLVFDGQGNLLTHTGELREGDEALFSSLKEGAASLVCRGELASYCRNAAGWTFVVMTPRSLFLRQAFQSLLPMTLTLSAVLAATILLGIAFLKEQRQPLKRIFDLLPDHLHGQLETLDDIERSLQTLQNDREQLVEACRLKTSQMRDACLNQLLNGSLFGSKSYAEMMQAAGIRIPPGRLRAAYMFLSGHPKDKEALSVSVISECLTQCGESVQLLTPVAPRHYVLVIPGEAAAFEDSAAYRLLTQLHTAVFNQFGLNCVFYVGIEVPAFDEFHYSLESARNIMCVGSDQEQFLFVARRNAPVSYDYTDRQEEMLRQLVTGGCKDEAIQLMGKIYVRNFSGLSLDSHQARLLYARLLNTLVHCASDFHYKLPDPFLEEYGSLEPNEFFEQAQKHLLAMCELALQNHADDSRRTVDRMIAYLNGHYMLPEMSLGHLSMQFGLTEPYISTVLHDRLGKTFAAYLEELRILHARSLLEEEPGLSLDELAARVGYANTRTFQRAFSRVLSCSPASYRRQAEERKRSAGA